MEVYTALNVRVPVPNGNYLLVGCTITSASINDDGTAALFAETSDYVNRNHGSTYAYAYASYAWAYHYINHRASALDLLRV